jgi:hypothetical protein
MEDRMENGSSLSNQALVIIEAFADGERVDPGLLKAALADEDARNHFVDVLLLREAMITVEPLVLAASPSRPDVRARAKWLTAAAAAVLVSLSVGYAAGQRLVAPAAPPPNVEVFMPMTQPVSAPAPTRSIAFTRGVNWTETSEAKP